MTDIERCTEFEKFKKIEAALRAAVDEPDSVPDSPMPLAIGPCLEYAIYHSPLAFIRTLLEIKADPKHADNAGFPPLIAALSCSRSHLGSQGKTPLSDEGRFLIRHIINSGDKGGIKYGIIF
jgi:uncharacterized protein